MLSCHKKVRPRPWALGCAAYLYLACAKELLLELTDYVMRKFDNNYSKGVKPC